MQRKPYDLSICEKTRSAATLLWWRYQEDIDSSDDVAEAFKELLSALENKEEKLRKEHK